jgi:hypothetical protein
MKHKNIVQSLHRSLSQAPTPDFESLISLPYEKQEAHDFITRQEEKQEAHPVRRYTAALSLSFVLLFLVAGGWLYQYRLPSSMISLDVNPSIEILTNRHNQVLEINAMNEDARKVLGKQDFRLATLDTAVASIVTEVIDQGYLNNEKNVIMVSVENNNKEKAEMLADTLNLVIKKSASIHDMNPKILRQTLKKDKAAEEEAKKLEVSIGKLKLMKKIEASSETLSVESLAEKSMTELLTIAEENEVDLKDTVKLDEEQGDKNKIKNKKSKEKDADQEKNTDKDKAINQGNKQKVKGDKDQARDEDQKIIKDKDKDKNKIKDKSKIKDKNKNKDRSKERYKDKSKDKIKDKSKGKNNTKSKDRHKDKYKDNNKNNKKY